MLQGQLANLRVECLEIWRVRRGLGPAKHLRGSRQQLLFPFGDLRGMDPELFGQVRQRLVASHCGQGNLRVEGRSMIASRSLHRLAPLVCHHSVGWVKPGYHLPHCPNFRSPLSVNHIQHLPAPRIDM